jgi:hypothetical protein
MDRELWKQVDALLEQALEHVSDINTKRVREVFSTGENEIRSIDVSSDGKLLYLSIYTSESDIYLMDLE